MSYIAYDWWGNIQDPGAIFAVWKNHPEYKKVFSVPLLPKNISVPYDHVPESTKPQLVQAIHDGSVGIYDAKWESFADHLHEDFPNESVYIRLAWEANCQSCGWSFSPPGMDIEEWKSYFRRVVGIIRTKNPLVKIVFCAAMDVNDTGHIAVGFYPGDESVDLIGVDTFDRYNPLTDDTTSWDGSNGMNSPTVGISYWSNFAKSRNKKFCIPEWGLADISGSPASYGGDNPRYIRKMFEFITDRTNNVEFAIYTPHFHYLSEPKQIIPMPNAMAAYKETFSKVYNYTPSFKKKLSKRELIINNGAIP
jgi:glycosyl hydrolase family 26